MAEESPQDESLTTRSSGKESKDCALVRCKCGAVEIKLFNPTPRMRCLCCCIDCNDAFRWAEERGGPHKINPVSDGLYFDNDLKVVRGEEHVEFYLLNEGYATKRLVTSCCCSTILGDHPGYKGNCVLVYGDFVQCCEYRPFDAILNKADLTKEQRTWLMGRYPSFSFRIGVFEDLDDFISSPKAEEILVVFGVKCNSRDGSTVQELIEKRGVVTLDWTPTNPDARMFPKAMADNLEAMEKACGDAVVASAKVL